MSNEKLRLNGFLRLLLVLLPLIILGLASAGGLWLMAQLPGGPAAPYGRYEPNKVDYTEQESAKPDGAVLYARNCAYCHGVNGDGQGTAPLGKFMARNFTAEKFKFTNTLNFSKSGGGTPTADHLVTLLEHGIPGSPMPSFASLPLIDRAAIVNHVLTRFVRPDARFEAKKQAKKIEADKSDEGFDAKSDWSDRNLAQWWNDSLSETLSGDPAPVPLEFPQATPDRLKRGEYLFKADAGLGCSKCHGPKGAGDGPQSKDANFKNENGSKAYPRDLTAGIYRGGGNAADLYRRVYLGIPGSPMPSHMGSAANPTSTEDLINVVLYVQSLSPDWKGPLPR
jgi:mono/diheme cytochrome c family protein